MDVATGAGIVISRHFGAGNREALSRAIGSCITLAAIASGVTMVVGTVLARPLLRLLDTPISVFERQVADKSRRNRGTSRP